MRQEFRQLMPASGKEQVVVLSETSGHIEFLPVVAWMAFDRHFIQVEGQDAFEMQVTNVAPLFVDPGRSHPYLVAPEEYGLRYLGIALNGDANVEWIERARAVRRQLDQQPQPKAD